MEGKIKNQFWGRETMQKFQPHYHPLQYVISTTKIIVMNFNLIGLKSNFRKNIEEEPNKIQIPYLGGILASRRAIRKFHPIYLPSTQKERDPTSIDIMWRKRFPKEAFFKEHSTIQTLEFLSKISSPNINHSHTIYHHLNRSYVVDKR